MFSDYDKIPFLSNINLGTGDGKVNKENLALFFSLKAGITGKGKVVDPKIGGYSRADKSWFCLSFF